MNAFALCGVALLCFAAIEVLGRDAPRIALVVGALGALCLLAPAVLALAGIFEQANDLLAKFAQYGGDQLLRAFGIGLCCEVTGDVLRDAGRQGLANALDFSCKTAILLLCVPLWKQLFEVASELLP